MRVFVASLASYIFFNRGECTALYLGKDMVVTDDYTTPRPREKKGYKALRAGMRNTRQIACSDRPRVGDLLRA